MNVKFADVFFVWKDEEAEKEESRYYRQGAGKTTEESF